MKRENSSFAVKNIIELLRKLNSNVLVVPVNHKKPDTVKYVQLAFVDCVCRSGLTAAFVVWLFGEYEYIIHCTRLLQLRPWSFRFKMNFGFLGCFDTQNPIIAAWR